MELAICIWLASLHKDRYPLYIHSTHPVFSGVRIQYAAMYAIRQDGAASQSSVWCEKAACEGVELRC